jgi:hypothetical protein
MWDPGPLRALTAAAHSATPYGHPIDVEGYVRLVRFVRGQAPASELMAPFAYRPLGPALAALVPAPAMTAQNVVNLACLIAVLVLLDAVGQRLGLGRRALWAAGLLFAVSFPAFYYGTIGFIDPVAMLGATVLLVLVLREAPSRVLALAMVFAVLAKETNAIFALLPLGAMAGSDADRGSLRRTALLVVVAALTVLLIRVLMPVPGEVFPVTPRLQAVVDNLLRPRTHLSLLLTIALPFVLAGIARRSWRAVDVLGVRALGILSIGALAAAALYAGSLFAAHADGRVIWIAYPFLIPIGVTLIRDSGSKRRVSGQRAAVSSS